jgi:hypothetical protein
MPASVRKSLTVRFMAAGRSLRDAECRAAAILTGCPGIAMIAGYRPGDAERERLWVSWYEPGTRSAIMAGHCGIFPEHVDRDHILLHCQRKPALPDRCGEYDGNPGVRRISSAVPGPATMVCW